MQAIEGNISVNLCKMDSSENYCPTDDDVCLNAMDWYQGPKKSTGILRNKEKKVKLCISALGLLLMFGALVALCAIGILYHNKVASFESLHQQYVNATATLMMQEHKFREKDRMYEALKAKYQELDFACNTNQTNRHCEEEWKSLGLKCYYFSTNILNWAQSQNFCVKKGGHLVIITSKVEQNFVSLHTGETHWIGLNDLETEGKWMWVNNQSLNETGETFWYSDGPIEPDNWKKEDPSGENCAALGHEMGYSHKWFDASCRKMKRFICEK